MEALDVLVIGRSCLDFIAVVENFPEENKKAPLIFRMVEGGGQGGTSSCCVSKLGGRVAYIGKLGDDDEGRFCLGRFKDFGVHTDLIDIVKNGRTPIAYIFVTRSNGNRTIIYESSSLPKIELESSREKVRFQAKTVLLDPEATYLLGDIKSIFGETSRIIYDGERWRDGIVDVMATADYFVPSADFLDAKELGFGRLSFSDRILALKNQIHGELVVTSGADGAYYISDERLYRVPALNVSVKDTTGAGDNFHAAFALALSRGASIHEAVKFSVAVASLSCQAYGGRNGIPAFHEAIKNANTLPVNLVKP